MERDSRRGLHVAWSQDELHKRTRLQRFAAEWWRRVLAAALVLSAFGGLVIGAGIAITEGALHPHRRPPAPEDPADARRVATEANAALNDVALIAHDGAVLAAWSVSRPGPARGTVVVLHGIGDGRASQLPLAALLLSDGYRVLVPDARAHGASGGTMLTAGITEAVDLDGWVEWIRQQHPNECIFAIGTSFGGATALQSLARTPYCAVVVEAPFASAYSMAFYWLGGRVPLVVRWALMGPVVEAGFCVRAVALRPAASHRGCDRARQPLARSTARDRRRTGRCGAETRRGTIAERQSRTCAGLDRRRSAPRAGVRYGPRRVPAPRPSLSRCPSVA